MPDNSEGKPATFTNPVYPHSFPDPFVLKFRGEYFAYCTGDTPDGNVFQILRSPDLVHWQAVGSAMSPLDSRPPYYWAPEVNYDNGKFYLYYSAGNEILMAIRIAVADRPEGPFIDAGLRLTQEEFAIDAHVFVDDDGTRYFFYATDFLEYAQIGTGTVVDRMLDPLTLEGHPRPVTRARYDWQVYDPARKEKGGVRWYTVEGPTVLKRKGKYFEMFSGGNWQNKSYGVSFAVTDDISREEEWAQYCDGDKIFPILRTIPDKVVGPGHNSVVRGPNNRELYCIYHRWTDAGRVLSIDRMGFAGDRIFVAGPTTVTQIAPFKPDRPTPELRTGNCAENNAAYITDAEGECIYGFGLRDGSFRLEATAKFIAWAPNARAGIRLRSGNDSYEFSLTAETSRANLGGTRIDLPGAFDPSCHHLICMEMKAGRCTASIDTPNVTAAIEIDGEVNGIELFSTDASVEFSALEVTYGFEELFEDRGQIPKQLMIDGGTADVSGGRMTIRSAEGGQVSAFFRVPYENFEVTANLSGADDGYGLFFMKAEEGVEAYLTIYIDEKHIVFFSAGDTAKVDMPEGFDGAEFRQFQVVFLNGRAIASLEGVELAELPAPSEISRVAIYAETQATVEMVRLTSI